MAEDEMIKKVNDKIKMQDEIIRLLHLNVEIQALTIENLQEYIAVLEDKIELLKGEINK